MSIYTNIQYPIPERFHNFSMTTNESENGPVLCELQNFTKKATGILSRLMEN